MANGTTPSYPSSRVDEVIYARALSKRKGVDLLLEAVRKLPADRRSEIVIVFLGDGELRPELESRAICEPRVHVRFVGFQNQSQLSAYYHSADLLVLPSIHSETWGLVVNEAMHHGIATVVSEGVGCGPDLVVPGKTGEICSTGSADELAGAISRALNWCTMPRVRERCKTLVAGYSVEDAARGISHAYGMLPKNRGSLNVMRRN
jgi:glycosyltransferase involved in cell wall biosynthesis